MSVVENWSDRATVFSNPGREEEAIHNGTHVRWLKVVNDPRYIMQQIRRGLPAYGPSESLNAATILFRAKAPALGYSSYRVEPVYETVEGWQGKTALARSWADLPAPAIKYVRRVEELVGCSVALLSTSPEREDTILVHNPFEN